MRKKCIAIAKKAMVWALAASMLVATPLTASAAGLRGVFSVSDGTNNDIRGEGDSTHTGTVSTTDSNTTVLGENDAKIIGIVLDKEQVNAVKGKPTTLKATVVLDNVVDEEVVKALNSKIKWEVRESDGTVHSDTNKKLSITVKATDRTEATLNPRQGTVIGEDMKVVAMIDGKQKITFTNDEGERIEKEFEGLEKAYEASADVFIKEYTESIKLDQNIPTQYVKHTLDMNDYIVSRVPATANDTITWSISTTVKNAATISASGIVTIKTYKANTDNKVVVTAVTERGAKDTAEFVIDPGKKAEQVTINEVKDGDLMGDPARGIKTRPMDMGGTDPDSDGVQFHATMWRKVNGTLTKDTDIVDEAEQITDDITWTSNKPAIVEVSSTSGVHGEDVILKPLKVGTATITAKSTNGKSVKLTVKVSATLNKLALEDNGVSLWSGQSLTMTVTRDPEQNTDALKWSIEKVNNGTKDIANPNASINSKGVLTIKNVINTNYKTVTVRVTSKKDSTKTATADIYVDQSSINGITVAEINGNSTVDLARVNATDSRDKLTGRTSALSVPKGKTYIATVDAGSTGGAESLKWTSSSAKVVEIENKGDGTAKITALAKGTATITVSGVYVSRKNDDGSAKTAKVIKTTFKVSVKQPATSLTINKSEVVLKDTQKLQNVTFTVKQNKNAKDAITWSAVQTKGSNSNYSIPNSAKGKFTLAKDGYKAGDEFVVTAKAASGVTATATIKVVTTSAAVIIRDPEKESANWGDDYYTYTQVKSNGTPGSVKKNATVLGLGDSLELNPVVNVGTKNDPEWIDASTSDKMSISEETERVAAEVTYSVNKQGIVQIIGNTVYRVKEGTVVVTVKTKDGKSYKLTIDDVSKKYDETANN